MSMAATSKGRDASGRDLLRWGLSAIAVLLTHGALAFVLTRGPEAIESADVAGAFVIELAPIPVARAEVPRDIAPGPDQVQSDAVQERREVTEEPVKETPPEPSAREPDVSLPAPEPPKIEQVQPQSVPRQAVAATTAAQVDTEKTAERAAAPVIGAPSLLPSRAIPDWQNKVVVVIERNKRYPAAAQARGEQGEAHLSFTIDRQGRLLASRVVRSSGSKALDGEALALLIRAQPFPAPPGEMPGAELTLAVPIRFNIR